MEGVKMLYASSLSSEQIIEILSAKRVNCQGKTLQTHIKGNYFRITCRTDYHYYGFPVFKGMLMADLNGIKIKGDFIITLFQILEKALTLFGIIFGVAIFLIFLLSLKGIGSSIKPVVLIVISLAIEFVFIYQNRFFNRIRIGDKECIRDFLIESLQCQQL